MVRFLNEDLEPSTSLAISQISIRSKTAVRRCGTRVRKFHVQTSPFARNCQGPAPRNAQLDKSDNTLEFNDARKETDASFQELQNTSLHPTNNTGMQNFRSTTQACCTKIRCTDPEVLQPIDIRHASGSIDDSTAALILSDALNDGRAFKVSPNRKQSDHNTRRPQVPREHEPFRK